MQPPSSTHFPPLIGDRHGRYRIKIVGNSGVGKSTLGAALASLLDVPYISLDMLQWEPGWRETPTDEFRKKIRKALDQDERGWVADGNYLRKGGIVVEHEATDIIWLDPPLILYFPRLLLRTMFRLLRLGPPCSPGCFESFREVFFSKASIVWWCLSHHWSMRKREQTRMKEIGIGLGVSFAGESQKMRRIGGWGGELKAWWKEVEDLVRIRGQSVP